MSNIYETTFFFWAPQNVLCNTEIIVITGGRVFQIAHGMIFILSSIKNYMFKCCNRRWICPVHVQTRAKFTKPKPTWCKAI